MVYRWRIIDLEDNSIIANGIPSSEQAHETLAFYISNYPQGRFELERYSDMSTPGWATHNT